MAKKTEYRTVLVTRFSALGDVAMTIPVIYGACAANPAVRFVVVTKRVPAGLFLHRPPNLVVESIDLSAYHGIAGLRRLYSELWNAFHFDAFVDLHDVLRTKVLRMFARLQGIPVSHVDKARRARKALTRGKNKTLIPLEPVMKRYRDAFDALHINVAESFRSLFPSGKADPLLFNAISSPKMPAERWIAVAPFAAHKGKIYPLNLLKKVIDSLAARDNTKIFMFGAGKQEADEIASLAAGRKQIINVAGLKAGMTAELALMSNCDVMLAMDSANMHMASLVGLPTVSIWGATHPYAGFYGFRQDPADAVQLDMVCRPCSIFGNRPCSREDYHCLSGIPPQLVVSRIDAKLHKTNTQ